MFLRQSNICVLCVQSRHCFCSFPNWHIKKIPWKGANKTFLADNIAIFGSWKMTRRHFKTILMIYELHYDSRTILLSNVVSIPTYLKHKSWVGSVAQCVLSQCEALGLIFSTSKKKKKPTLQISRWKKRIKNYTNSTSKLKF
jgi:hypothetical protein